VKHTVAKCSSTQSSTLARSSMPRSEVEVTGPKPISGTALGSDCSRRMGEQLRRAAQGAGWRCEALGRRVGPVRKDGPPEPIIILENWIAARRACTVAQATEGHPIGGRYYTASKTSNVCGPGRIVAKAGMYGSGRPASSRPARHASTRCSRAAAAGTWPWPHGAEADHGQHLRSSSRSKLSARVHNPSVADTREFQLKKN
jgi:hypothetical protein